MREIVTPSESTARKRRALNTGMGYLSKIVAEPERAPDLVRDLDRDMAAEGVDPRLAVVIARDVTLGAVLHAPTLHPLLSPARGARSTRATTGQPFYVDGYYFTRPLPEPLNSIFVTLADGGLFTAQRRFPALFSDRAEIHDPLLSAAIEAHERVPPMPWEAERRMTARQRLRKLVAGSIVDDVFSAVALVVGAEQTLRGDPHHTRQVILRGMASLRLPALLDRKNLVGIWKLRAPFNTEDGRMSGIPVVERKGERFHYPAVTSGTSLCVGMYPIIQPKAALDAVGGYGAFRELMGPNVKELDDGTVQYRLADVDIANVCASAEPFWRAGRQLAPPGTFEPPERPNSPDESDHWPSLF